MARSGVYISDVKRVRDQLVAQGRRPSIDAIRAALGDTGSKTTIHKYLRELETEEGVNQQSASDAILALTRQLAAQLKVEADAQIATVQEQMAVLRGTHETVVAALNKKVSDAEQAIAALSADLAASRSAATGLTTQLHAEQMLRHTAEQHAIDLDGRLADARQHQASLEDKHRHARDALEHYRTAAKEQREQESRRHEQQVHAVQAELRQVQRALAVKGEDLTRLNKEAAAMASELGANKQVLYLEKEAGRKLARKVEQLQTTEARVAVLEAQLTESRERAAEAVAAAGQDRAQCNTLREEKAVLEEALRVARDNSALEERLAKLDQAVFGAKRTAGPDPDQSV